MSLALVALAIIVCATLMAGSFVLGVSFAWRWLDRHQPKPQIVKIPEPFVVKETKEVVAPSFQYPRAGTPNPKQEQADKKLQELITDPEI